MLSTRTKTLIAVADYRNFTKAASVLCLTQPAVSHHISQLEDELGVSLFIRKKNGLELTPEGEIVVRYARRMNVLYNKLRKELTDIEKQPAKLCVGITHTAESNLTTEALARCSSEADGFSIMVVTDTINNLYNRLENYELDLAIVEGTGSPQSFSSLVLNTDFLVCVMSSENHLSGNAMITLSELRNEPMILRLPSSATRIQFDSELRNLGDAPENYNIILEVDNIATIKDLVKKNLGISVLPQSACQKEIRKGNLIALPIENLSMARETRIVYNKDFSRMDILQTITAAYRETVRRYQ
ncbi:MAG: LysR family transcriptional regulator [Spirochaetes bacterium]|uniref:LysR family transcriptional regulator n=1 Tax=Candidatus Ornithospirochaeta stercoravium TaxID=2840897 RepID=A0A9D9IC58_9SPIO|nr:LysR family transcriptional regulator [Candidatus Ornithospirochaeta stercoravium]